MNKKSFALFLAMTLMISISIVMLLVPNAKATATVDTDEPIYAYWTVGGNVTIFGSGYDPYVWYGVWITYPGAGSVLFSTFTAVTDFEYIHPLSSPFPAGTYLVEILEFISGPLVASCNFGVWGIDASIYNRGESITISGGGVNPLSTVAIDIYHDDDGDLAATGDQTQMDDLAYWGTITDPTADAQGEFIKLVDIPIDAWVSTNIDAIYFVEITYDSYDGGGTTETSLTDTQTFEVSATYTISWTIPAAALIRNRGHTQDFEFSVADASGDPVSGLTILYLDIDGVLATTDDQYGVPITEGAAGEYTGSWLVPSDAPTGAYDCIVIKSGNRGETADYVTVSDLLIVDLTVGASTYGGLETIYFEAVIDYEDGADFTDIDGWALADIWIEVDDDGEIDAGEFVADTDVPLVYDSGSDIWYRYYDLYPPGVIGGTYKIKVYAEDPYDNFGTDSVTFDVVAQTMKDPTHGPVGTEVEIWGSGFAPNMPVTVTYYMSITDDVIGVGDGMRTDFTLVMMPVWIVEDSEAIYLDGVVTEDYTINYATGMITFSTPPGFGVVITADYDYRIYLAWTSTNETGSFFATFTVPESYVGPHGVDAFQEGIDPVRDIFTVESQIVLSSTKGPPEGWITITGTGFAPNSEVEIDAILPGYPGMPSFEWCWAIAQTDPLGTFSEAVALPVLNLQMMYWDSGISIAPIGIYVEDSPGNWDFTFYIATLFCESSTIDVQVQVGALYFPGEIITAYASTSVDGVPTDVENIEFLVYYETAGPTPITQWIPVIHIDTGLYAITTTLSPDERPGNYLIEVKASKITHYGWDFFEQWWMEWGMWFEDMGAPDYWFGEWEIIFDEFMDWDGIDVTINGCGIDGFIISPTLMGMNAYIIDIKGEIADIVIPGIGNIQVTLDAIRAEELAELLSNTADLLDGHDLIVELLVALENKLDLTLSDLATLIGAVAGNHEELVSLISDLKTQLELDHEALAVLITEVFDGLEIKLDDIKAEIIGIEQNVDGLYLVIGDLEVKLDDIQAKLVDIQGDIATIITTLGEIETKIDNLGAVSIEEIKGDIATIKSDVGTIKVDVSNINGDITSITGRLVTIETTVGTIQEDIGDINGTIVSIEGDIATIQTDLGTVKTSLTDINTKITVSNDNIATIETDIGTVKGRLTTIEGDVAFIKTEIGTLRTTTESIQTTGDSIKADTTLQPATVALSLIAAISAIAAAVMLLRKVYLK